MATEDKEAKNKESVLGGFGFGERPGKCGPRFKIPLSPPSLSGITGISREEQRRSMRSLKRHIELNKLGKLSTALEHRLNKTRRRQLRRSVTFRSDLPYGDGLKKSKP